MSRDEAPMRKQEGVDGFCQRQARDVVDTLFDARVLSDDLPREAIDRTEDYLAFLFQSLASSAIQGERLSVRMKEVARRQPATENPE